MSEKSLKFIQARIAEEFARLQNIYDYSKKITDANALVYLTKTKSIPSIRCTYRELLDKEQSILMEKGEDYTPEFKKMPAFDEMADVCVTVAQNIEDKRLMRSNSESSSSSKVKPVVQCNKIKLPPQTIPIFDGVFENWMSFHQLFKKLIHENGELSNLEKVNYLVSRLEGSAKSIIAGIIPSEDNYNRLYDTLVKRYEDPMALGTYYMDKLLKFKPLVQESERDLNDFLNNFVEPAMALKEINFEAFVDFVIVYLAIKKLDKETCREFENAFRHKEMPSFADLEQFIRKQVKLVARHQQLVGTTGTRKPGNFSLKKTCALVVHNSSDTAPDTQKLATKSSNCVACKSEKAHPLYRCPVFQKLSPSNRFEIVKRNKLCYNCFNKHFTQVCESKATCRHCFKKHHSMLHFIRNDEERNNKKPSSSSTDKTPIDTPARSPEHEFPLEVQPSTSQTSAYTSSLIPVSTVLLATAQVSVIDCRGQPNTVRVLLDSGSQSHFISKDCCQRLGLQGCSVKAMVNCLNGKSAAVQEMVSFTISSLIRPAVKFDIDAFVLNEITGDLPSMPVKSDGFPHLDNLRLADQHFNTPGPIDILISASLWPKIMGTRKIVGPSGTPSAFDSCLGWVVLGEVGIQNVSSSLNSFLSIVEPSIENLMERFWTLEEIPSQVLVSPEDQVCEEHFLKRVIRNQNGGFTVALPFKQSPQLLGDSLHMCTRRFLSQERKLLQNPHVYNQYIEVMNNHIMNGYISQVPIQQIESTSPVYYVPHHGVFKPSSTSTPLRIVWDMSAASSTGYSLNDLVYTGPKLQADIFTILLNFRLFPVAMSADVKQMFLRVLVHPDDRCFQRLLWRSHPREKLTVWQVNTVVFGLATSPYLAQRVIRYLVDLEGHKFPLAASVVLRDLYMDDIAVSVETEEEASKLHTELVELFQAGSFTLAKWCTNSPAVSAAIPQNIRLEENVDFDSRSSTKILGICWNPDSDVFSFKLNRTNSLPTKRSVLSSIARIFDPLGLLAPLIVVAKIMLKTLWSLKVGWDDPLPPQICRQWSNFLDELPAASSLAIPRHIGVDAGWHTTLVGFADASKLAYGAVVYICARSPSQDVEISVRLLCAKSCISPMKCQTIPRLELCAALVLSRLLRSVRATYNSRHTFDQIVACSDSTVALQWLSGPAHRWKPFVANRVRQIQENLDKNVWYHVAGDSNPADCLSRGIGTKALLEHPMWFNGPSWLRSNREEWPLTHSSEFSSAVPTEEIRVVTLKATSRPVWPLSTLLTKVSSLRRLHRVTAWALRFCRISNVRVGPIQLSELQHAEHLWLKNVQSRHFLDIFNHFTLSQQKNRKVPKLDLSINRLDLFIDEGIIRVGGRLQNASLHYDQQHPVLLPKSDDYVNLLIDQYHKDNLHTGPYLLMSLIRQRFWILSARTAIRKRVHNCNVCFRAKPKPTAPKMAPLPSCRLQEAKAFTHCGVDYAGPFSISISRGRGNRTQKAYLCLFVCMSTKAVHLELASNLSTPCFLATFKRFLSRRGPCQVLYSDQGTNFVGARTWMKELYSLTSSPGYSQAVSNELTLQGVSWKLNPPAAPHFGGLWEANVRSVKNHLTKIMGEQVLTYEELTTVLTQIEALLNSRPLCSLSNDPKAPSALTPAHFLTLGSTLNNLPAATVTNIPQNRLDHYQRVDWIVQHYWKRWSQEYLHTLQQRMKWQESTTPISVGNVVVIMKENTPPLQWPLAVVEEIFPAQDGVVRVAKLRTSGGHLIRPVVKLCLLPTQ